MHYPTKAPLSSKEQLPLIKKAQKGDKVARDALVSTHMGIILREAKIFLSSGALLEDLVHEGVVGLLEAIDKFDPRKASKLSTVGIWHIKMRMQLISHKSGSMIKYVENRRDRFSNDLSLLAPCSSDESSGVIGDNLVDRGPTPEQIVARKDTIVKIQERLTQVNLTPLDKSFLNKKLLADKEDQQTNEQIGKPHRVKKGMVKELGNKLIAVLRDKVSDLI